MANSNWSFDEYKRPEHNAPSDRAVPVTPRTDRIPEPVDGWAALQELFDRHEHVVSAGSINNGEVTTFYPQAELVAEGLVDIFVHELDILDCPACFDQHFKLGETCRKHDV